MARTSLNILISFILMAGSLSVNAQEKGSVKASVDKNQILIGEPIRLSIDVKSPMVSGNLLPQFDSIPHFELIEKGSRDSIITAAGASYHLEWKLTSFDSGTRYIPSFPISIGKEIYKTDSLAIEVSYGIIDTSKDYHDIKGIIDIENPNVKYIPWAVGALTLLALVLFIWFIRKPFVIGREPLAVGGDKRKTPLEEAMEQLSTLKIMIEKDPAAVKKYYSGLNDALRIYLNREFGMVTMEKTSEELIHSISNLKMEREAFSRLTAALRMGDFVKFAKYIPGPFEIDSDMKEIREGILLLNEIGGQRPTANGQPSTVNRQR
jgi:hypothetical protein